MAADLTIPVILLNSGETFRLKSVVLYDEQSIHEVESLKAQAIAKAGPVSSGIGFIGSPAWVLGGAAVMSLLEGAATKANQQQAFVDLQEAQRKSQAIIESATYFDFNDVVNAHLPHPELWRAERQMNSVIELSSYGWGARSDLLKRYGKTKADIVDNKITIASVASFVHNGSEFIQVDTEVGRFSVRWSSVAAYRCDQSASSAARSQRIAGHNNPFT